jgi:hypothetical protein
MQNANFGNDHKSRRRITVYVLRDGPQRDGLEGAPSSVIEYLVPGLPEPGELGPVQITKIGMQANGLAITFPTVLGVSYVVEADDNFPSENWNPRRVRSHWHRTVGDNHGLSLEQRAAPDLPDRGDAKFLNYSS